MSLFFVLIIFITFSGTSATSLWDQDEGAYAGFAKNMIESGDWLVPSFTWSEIHRKPPLHFWNIAVSYKLFGVNEFSVRLPSALSIIGLYFLIFFYAKKLFKKSIAFLSVVVLSTTLGVSMLAKVSVTDATVLFFSTACGFAFLDVLKNRSRFSVFIFWLAFALAMLTKGPTVIIFSSILVGLVFILYPQRKNIFFLKPWFFLPLSLIPIIGWGYLASLKDEGQFISWMIDFYILKRIGGSVLGQTGPIGTHMLFITVFFIPYFMFLPKAIWEAVRNLIKDRQDYFLLGAWFVAGWLIYEFSPSKLPTYSVVAHVPLAIIIAHIIERHLQERTKPALILRIIHVGLFMLLSVGLIVAVIYFNLSLTLIISVSIFALILTIGLIMLLVTKGVNRFFYIVFGINIFFHLFLSFVLFPQIDAFKNNTKNVAMYLKTHTKHNANIILANDVGHPPSLPFYVSLYFDKISTVTDMKEILPLYESSEPYAFVLKKNQKEDFQKQYLDIDAQSITTPLTKILSLDTYYVIINESGREIRK